MAEDPKTWSPQHLLDEMGELEFQRQYMGQPAPPLRIGGYRIKVVERIHPQIRFKLKDGEIHFDHEVDAEGDIEAVLMMNALTWEYMEKHIFRLEEGGSFFRQRWGNMHPEQFQAVMHGATRRASQHFYEAGALRVILEDMRNALHRESIYGFRDRGLEKAHRIVCEANNRIGHIIEPSMWNAPLQFRIEPQGEDGLLILPLHCNTLPHENFMKEFGHVIKAWEYAWRGGRPESEPDSYELRSDDEPFPPDP